MSSEKKIDVIQATLLLGSNNAATSEMHVLDNEKNKAWKDTI